MITYIMSTAYRGQLDRLRKLMITNRKTYRGQLERLKTNDHLYDNLQGPAGQVLKTNDHLYCDLVQWTVGQAVKN